MNAPADRVVALADLPPPDSGASEPRLYNTERVLLLAYRAAPRTEGEVEAPDRWALLRFGAPLLFRFGYPNDEVLHAHELFPRGLGFYGAYEVEDSSWLGQVRRMNEMHDRHRPESFSRCRHFVLTFQDSTFECLAESAEVLYEGASFQAVERRVAEQLHS